ncbi:peptidyl-arginine deiminase [Salmonella enterica]|uniref:Peptidyl-arginine deiminase n=2 Tax=Salmonella TaxID=590 RepID=A0A379TQX7_SALDZ|nr:peptidyl-arginine deiminase [Salmonella enterica]ECH9341526.1 peptidyl-arginine deiminase [Salmonella enterica subsp. diarizonae]EDQ9399680.1 peptidyl-arginine deiminase [Salmonella enterica]EDR4377677.1 peptidyl-arginine deiminase [Salmonella enterica]EDU9903095.1 peptidyl-arginine deiminase [Salmonella enterica subsp. diarizonae]EEA3740374.1 peptidyl-arginine deiminase [Salmonella enterica]
MGKSVIYASDKGGVGKTTTVTNTASALVNKSKSVAILKTDKNPDILNWNRRRQENGLPPVPVYEAYGDISKEIKRLTALHETVLVDCAGHDSQEFRSALTVADVLVTLVKPSSAFERDTLTDVTEKVRKAQRVNPSLQPWVLFTRIENNKATKVRDAIDLDKFLRSDPVWIQPLKTRIASLDIFESACNEGAGVHDVARGSKLGEAKGQIELYAAEIGIL